MRCPSLDSLKFDDDRQYGVNIIRRAVEEPLRQIASNAGVDGSIVVEKVRNGKGAFGFNAATEEYEDLVKAGVIDPTKVVRAALQNAASVASLMLTTEALIAERPKKKAAGGGGGGGHGGARRHGRHGRRRRLLGRSSSEARRDTRARAGRLTRPALAI